SSRTSASRGCGGGLLVQSGAECDVEHPRFTSRGHGGRQSAGGLGGFPSPGEEGGLGPGGTSGGILPARPIRRGGVPRVGGAIEQDLHTSDAEDAL
ncbi:MAG: hypothetical protein ACE5I5_08935, partial [Candidatus Heimdallarchaeota archaeon]